MVIAARYGPVRSRWWRHENPFGFALFVGAIGFLAGFIASMMFAPGASQGPLLTIFYAGPIGMLAGLVWGFLRAARRRDQTKDQS